MFKDAGKGDKKKSSSSDGDSAKRKKTALEEIMEEEKRRKKLAKVGDVFLGDKKHETSILFFTPMFSSPMFLSFRSDKNNERIFLFPFTLKNI